LALLLGPARRYHPAACAAISSGGTGVLALRSGSPPRLAGGPRHSVLAGHRSGQTDDLSRAASRGAAAARGFPSRPAAGPFTAPSAGQRPGLARAAAASQGRRTGLPPHRQSLERTRGLRRLSADLGGALGLVSGFAGAAAIRVSNRDAADQRRGS